MICVPHGSLAYFWNICIGFCGNDIGFDGRYMPKRKENAKWRVLQYSKRE